MTAVETLIEIYYGNEGQLRIKDLEQAKQLEKQQIIQAHEDAYMDCGFEYSASDCANNYYKERYDKV